MNRSFQIADIRKALDVYEKKYPEKTTIQFSELEKLTSKFKIPAIYNLEELIRLLTDFMIQNPTPNVKYYKERRVYEILRVKKLTMHQWRKKGYIRYRVLLPRSIMYLLPELLADFQNIQSKNIPS